MTELDNMRVCLEDSVARMSASNKALFLLAYAQRLSQLFAEFEKRAPTRSERFGDVLERLWCAATSGAAGLVDMSVLEDMIPGEDWVVDGLYDTLAQNVGGLAVGALEAMVSPGASVWRPEMTVFDTIRLLLAEMRLGRTEPGEDAAGELFDDLLHTEPLVEAERRFWVGLVEALDANSLTPDELRSMALREALEVSSLEPDLTQGRAKDAIAAAGYYAKG